MSDCVVNCTVPFALRACTVAPATTAPDVSTTTPDSSMTPWAFAGAHNETVAQNRMIRAAMHGFTLRTVRMERILSSTYDYGIRVTVVGECVSRLEKSCYRGFPYAGVMTGSVAWPWRVRAHPAATGLAPVARAIYKRSMTGFLWTSKRRIKHVRVS